MNRIDQAHLGISEGTVDVINAQLVFSISDTSVDIVGIKNKNVQLLNYNNTFHITANNWPLVVNNAHVQHVNKASMCSTGLPRGLTFKSRVDYKLIEPSGMVTVPLGIFWQVGQVQEIPR